MKSFFSSSVPESLLSAEALSEDEAAPVSVFSAGLLPQAVSEAAKSAVHASSISVFFMINAFFPEETPLPLSLRQT